MPFTNFISLLIDIHTIIGLFICVSQYVNRVQAVLRKASVQNKQNASEA